MSCLVATQQDPTGVDLPNISVKMNKSPIDEPTDAPPLAATQDKVKTSGNEAFLDKLLSLPRIPVLKRRAMPPLRYAE